MHGEQQLTVFTVCVCLCVCVRARALQLLDNVENKMKGTCVEGTIPKLFRGKMVVCHLSFSVSSSS